MWFACRQFNDIFHLSFFDNKIKIEEAIGNDKGQPFLLTHFFYNKITYTPEQLFEKYYLFGDIRFGFLFFSIVGYFGIICGFLYFISKKEKNKN